MFVLVNLCYKSRYQSKKNFGLFKLRIYLFGVTVFEQMVYTKDQKPELEPYIWRKFILDHLGLN